LPGRCLGRVTQVAQFFGGTTGGSADYMVLRRPPELARVTGQRDLARLHLADDRLSRDLAPFTRRRHTRLGLVDDRRRELAVSGGFIAHGGRARDFCDCNSVKLRVCSRLGRWRNFLQEFPGGCRFRRSRFDVEVRQGTESRRPHRVIQER